MICRISYLVRLVNCDFELSPPFDKLLQKARGVVDAGVEDGLASF